MTSYSYRGIWIWVWIFSSSAEKISFLGAEKVFVLGAEEVSVLLFSLNIIHMMNQACSNLQKDRNQSLTLLIHRPYKYHAIALFKI